MSDSALDLSIIVPAYNCAHWLAATLESTRHVGVSLREVVVVDDGSTDETPEVLKALHASMPELRSVRQTNLGVSAARNHGIKLAKGRWILFLDSDDQLLPDSLTWLHNSRADMVRFGVEEDGLHGEVRFHIDHGQPCTGADYLQQRLERGSFYEPCWAYAYRAEWLRANGLSFQPGIIHEDMLFTPQALCAAKRVEVQLGLVYRYVRKAISITNVTGLPSQIRRINALSAVVQGLIRLGNRHPEVDLWRWAAHTIDYAGTFVKGSRRLGLRILAMELALYTRYTAWGRFRTRRSALYRLRWGMEIALFMRRCNINK